MSKQTRSKIPNDVNIVTNASTGDITHVRNSLTGEFGKVYSAKQIADIKAGAVNSIITNVIPRGEVAGGDDAYSSGDIQDYADELRKK